MILLIVGAIGIMNTMYTAIIERTRQIGVMKAIGATNFDIAFIFQVESGLLGFAGGVVGILIGMGIGKLVEVVAHYSNITFFNVSFPLVAFIRGFGILRGCWNFIRIISFIAGREDEACGCSALRVKRVTWSFEQSENALRYE